MLKEMMNNGAVEIKVLASTGREMVVKQATTNGVMIAQFTTQVIGEGFFNMATKRWQTNKIVAYKVDGEWKTVSEEKKRNVERMSLEEAARVIEEEVGAKLEKNKRRTFAGDPRYFLLYGEQVIPMKDGFEVVKKAKRIMESKEVLA